MGGSSCPLHLLLHSFCFLCPYLNLLTTVWLTRRLKNTCTHQAKHGGLIPDNHCYQSYENVSSANSITTLHLPYVLHRRSVHYCLGHHDHAANVTSEKVSAILFERESAISRCYISLPPTVRRRMRGNLMWRSFSVAVTSSCPHLSVNCSRLLSCNRFVGQAYTKAWAKTYSASANERRGRTVWVWHLG